jgi:hypothetical protein
MRSEGEEGPEGDEGEEFPDGWGRPGSGSGG